MHGYVDYDEDKIKELTEQADEQFSGYLYLVKSDQAKYGTLIKGLHSQKALQNDQYLKKAIETNNVLSTHRFDFIKEHGLAFNRDNEKSKNKDKDKDKDAENKNRR